MGEVACFDAAQMKQQPSKGGAALGLLALGVVFGDIGTSPLYAFQTAVAITGGGKALEVASLIVWTLTLVVAVKYVGLVMKADYHGEGGIFALMALYFNGKPPRQVARGVMAVMLLAGAALLFGDGAITPAISVLSATEGLATVNAEWAHLSMPLTVVILAGLFYSQKFGTNRLGGVFGPVMLVWFVTIGGLGLVQVALCPEVLKALNPLHAISLLASGGWGVWALIGAVVLAVTGAEALYADLGHFGRLPIVRAWRLVVFPALILNYLGQAALIMRIPAAASDTNLFFLLLPDEHLRMGLVLLATVATVIASQALISGVFSLASQAMDLGYLPRLYVRHTSAESRGQIYIPVVNAVLGTLCLMLVLGFHTSDRLAAAYGIAVTGAMGITSIAFVAVCIKRKGMAPWKGGLLLVGLLALDVPLFGACVTKIPDGGIVPILLAVAATLVLLTWRKGRDLVRESIGVQGITPELLGKTLARSVTLRTPGTTVFVMRQADPEYAIARIKEQHRRAGVLSETIVILLLSPGWDHPFRKSDNIRVTKHDGGLWEVSADHGFMWEPNVPLVMKRAQAAEPSLPPCDGAFYIVAQELILTCPRSRMGNWQKMLFDFMSRNVLPGPDYLSIPPDRLIVYNWMLRLGPVKSGA